MGILNYSCIVNLDARFASGSNVHEDFEAYVAIFPIGELSYQKGKKVSLANVIIQRALLNYKLKNGLAVNSKFTTEQVVDILLNHYANEPFLSRICAGFIIERAKSLSWTTDIDNATAKYVNVVPKDDEYAHIVLSFKEKMTINLIKNAFALKYTLADTTGEEFSISGLKGKIVLLDFMFLGCGGCKQMAPVLSKLKADLGHDNDIAFVSISIDQTLEKFKKGVGVYSPASFTHLFTNKKGSDHEIIKDLGVIAYPTLILINKEGRIISARAPDPRTKAGWDELYNLIIQSL
jgi:thiol-disulfide isomerase/thioredoxin